LAAGSLPPDGKRKGTWMLCRKTITDGILDEHHLLPAKEKGAYSISQSGGHGTEKRNG
jgi:hypothetical protein